MTALFIALFSFLGLLFVFIGHIPSFAEFDPSFTQRYTEYFQVLCEHGSGILNFFIDSKVLTVCLGLMMIVYVAEPIYRFILWFLKKIPFKITG